MPMTYSSLQVTHLITFSFRIKDHKDKYVISIQLFTLEMKKRELKNFDIILIFFHIK